VPDWKRGIRENLDLRGLEPTRQSEMVDDLAQQLDDAYRDGLARGMSEDEATSFAWSQCPDWPGLSRELRQSRRGAVGVLDRLERRACDAEADRSPWSAWATVAQDLVFAVRMMRKAPTFTAAAVLTLALGIGANSTIFSVMSATFLKPLPFPDPDRLALIWETPARASTDTNIVTAPRFWDWQRQNRTFEHVALFDSAGKGYNLGAADARHEAEQVSGVRVTADFFSVLGVRPFLGREFRREEETAGNDRVVVLGYGLWSRRYGSDRHLVGQPIRIDGESYTVVGVMPREFRFQFWSDERELWVPAGWNDGDRSRNSHSFVAIGRLKPAVAVAQATADIAGIQGQLAKQYPEDQDVSAVVTPMSEFGLDNVQRVMLTLLAAVAFVLLIGCVNVANLMLARGAERRKEFAIRRAMGASSARLARQLLAESLMLSALGGAAGLAFAFWASRVLTHVLPAGFATLPMRPLDAVGLDARVVGFTFLIACVTGVVSGLVPAFAAVRDDVGQPLKEGGRQAAAGGRRLVRHALVASEVGLALVVLVAAGLLIKSMTRLIAVDPGFEPKNVLTAEISVPQANLYYGPPGHPRFCEEIEDRLASIPGVLSASAVAHLPLRGNAGRGFSIEGRPEPAPGEDGPGGAYTVICPGYFRTLGVPVKKGREFTREDRLGSPGVVVVNEALARRYWSNEDPIGKRIRIGGKDAAEWLTIVGVVGNVRHWGLAQDTQPQFFRPYTQAAWPFMRVVVKTVAAPATFANPVKQAMLDVEPDRPVSEIQTMEAIVRGSVGTRRFPMLMLAALAGLALVLAAIGIGGVVSYSVTQATHEIGIRAALGAQRRNLLWLMITRSMTWVVLGVAAGGALSIVVTRLLKSMLYDVTPADPVVLAVVVGILLAVALAASYLPARRAARVDPLTALRSE
jgi:putative ABC transport system permease protein